MVTGIPYNVDDMDMSILFNPYDTRYIYLDKGKGRNTKFATIQFIDKKVAEDAIQALNKTDFKGNTIKVKWIIGEL